MKFDSLAFRRERLNVAFEFLDVHIRLIENRARLSRFCLRIGRT